MPTFAAALFLAAHGLVHLSFLARPPPPEPGAPRWPFDLGRSWLLTPAGLGPGPVRAIGVVLLALTVAGYAAAALALPAIAPAGWFAPAVAVASIASATMLALFFHRWLVLGLVIDAVLLWAVLVNGWSPAAAG